MVKFAHIGLLLVIESLGLRWIYSVLCVKGQGPGSECAVCLCGCVAKGSRSDALLQWTAVLHDCPVSLFSDSVEMALVAEWPLSRLE